MAGLSPLRSQNPLLTRRGMVSHPGMLLFGALAIAFAAFVLSYLFKLDVFFGHALKSGHGHGLSIALPILVALASLLVLALLLLEVRPLGRLFRSLETMVRFSRRTANSLQSFRKSAEMHGISPHVAEETYRALTPHYPKQKMCIQLQDNLWHLLHLSEEKILFIQSNVLNRCNRGKVLSFSTANLQTVLDLMRQVESAPPQDVRETRASGLDGPGAVGRREIALVGGDGMDLGRRGADRIPAEFPNRRTFPPDGGLHGAPTLARRRGDYNGTRRRTSDLAARSTRAEPASPAEIKPALFHPRNRSTDFTGRRRGDPPVKDPED